jgi:hypothetical protein
MDLNHLYYRHQVALFMAGNADSEDLRRLHRDFADGYASRIAQAKNPPRTAEVA